MSGDSSCFGSTFLLEFLRAMTSCDRSLQGNGLNQDLLYGMALQRYSQKV